MYGDEPIGGGMRARSASRFRTDSEDAIAVGGGFHEAVVLTQHIDPRILPAVLAPLIRGEIVWRLLCGRLGATLRQIGLAESHAARIGRATAWIRNRFAEPLQVADAQIRIFGAGAPGSRQRRRKNVPSGEVKVYQSG
jgi:hypothetical protein